MVKNRLSESCEGNAGVPLRSGGDGLKMTKFCGDKMTKAKIRFSERAKMVDTAIFATNSLLKAGK